MVINKFVLSLQPVSLQKLRTRKGQKSETKKSHSVGSGRVTTQEVLKQKRTVKCVTKKPSKGVRGFEQRSLRIHEQQIM